MQDLTQTQWREQLAQDNNAEILDVRTAMEVAEGYIPNSRNIDIQNAAGFMEEAKQLDSSKNYYVYCRSGGRSAQACMILNSLGFPNTYNLLGGMMEWEGETAT
ncbi:MAG: rhodanese-like domain-containing protein [Bacteroidota bacterium]